MKCFGGVQRRGMRFAPQLLFRILILLLCGLSAGCTTVSESSSQAVKPAVKQVKICHGYSCRYKSNLVLGPADGRRFASILAVGQKSPQAERMAIAQAVSYFERRTLEAIGIRDEPQSKFGASGVRGQMDCIDEATNTRTILAYFADQKLLKHHTVAMNASRGFLVDGRYPHSTAVIRDPSGAGWAVDSWYAPMGGSPDILPLSEWKPRGFLTSGALN
jgi:hypothetical protein